MHINIRCSIVVSISACHAEDPGSIPGRGDLLLFVWSICVAKFMSWRKLVQLRKHTSMCKFDHPLWVLR